MSSPNCCFLTCIQISQEPGQVVWYSQVYWHRTWESERWNDANIVLKSRTRIRYHFLKNRGKGLDFIECSVFALRDWYYIPYLTRKRNWKLSRKYVKLCPKWGSAWLFLSLNLEALILHIGHQHLQQSRAAEKGRIGVSRADFLMAPWIDWTYNRAFPRQFCLPEPRLSVVLLNSSVSVNFFPSVNYEPFFR